MDTVIEVTNLCKSMNGRKLLNNISLEVRQGSIFGLLGANGAGKTTLMKTILGILKSDSGTVKLFGETIDRRNQNVLTRIGCIIETPVFYSGLSARKNLEIHCKYMNEEYLSNIDNVLSIVGLSENAEDILDTFSLGMKQRLGIARALVTSPKLLILDEPINGLDPMGIIDIREILKEINQKLGTTILISSHIIPEVDKIVTDVAIMSQGEMIEHVELEQLKKENIELEEYFVSILHKQQS